MFGSMIVLLPELKFRKAWPRIKNAKNNFLFQILLSLISKSLRLFMGYRSAN